MKILESLYQCDTRMLLWCSNTSHRKLVVALARKISRSGDGYLQVLLPSLMLLVDGARGQQFFITVALGFAIQLPIYWLLKNSLKRRRPPEVIPAFESVISASDTFSFPSGHSGAAFLLANLCALFYGLMAWPLYVWASFVGLSRVILGVHFPTDILAGITMSIITSFYLLSPPQLF
jgi:undecaprenyl-diphosphatase